MKRITITRLFLPAIAAVIAVAATLPTAAAGTLAITEDFTNDGLFDMAVVTSPTTITVSLADGFGGYIVSAILSSPKNQQIGDIGAYDRDGDGDLDVYANCQAGANSWYTHVWYGNGDGTFGSRRTHKWSWPPKGNIGFF